MEYISAEEFLKQPKEVRKVFLDWWKENVKQYDLFYRKFHGERQKYIVVKSEGYKLETITLRNRKISAGRDAWTEDWNIECIWDIIPLLTEGQLRQFIEDKTDSSMSCRFEKYQNWFITDTYYIVLYDLITHKPKNTYESEKGKRVDAYWEVALEIAKE